VTDVLKGSWRLLALCWRQSRRKTWVAVVLMLSAAAASPLVALGLRELTNAVVAGHSGKAVLAGVLVAVLAVVGLTFGHFAHIAYFELSELNVLGFDEELIGLANGSAGLAHHERPEDADRLTVLEQDTQYLRSGLQALLTTAGLLLAMVLTGVLLALLNPVLLLLPLLAVPPLLTGRWAERIIDRAKTATAESSRLALNFFRLATTAAPAKELRVFRLREELRRRHGALWERTTQRLWAAHRQATGVRAAGQLVFAVGYVGAVLLIVREAIAGRRTVGDVVLAITLAGQVNQQVSQAVALLQDLQRMASGYRRLGELRDVVHAPVEVPVDQAPPERLREGIRLAGVAFGYPGSDTPVLRDVDLTLPAGSTIAVVGENGAGKSTLIKLLCGFYRPSAGQVLVDGVDLRRIPLDGWRGRIAAGFQDFVRYELVARQAVGVGDLAQGFTDPAVLAALDRARVGDLLERLPDGLDTQLGKSYADGAELSGGQWQKLALGRALMREEPLLLVLDEPTSALDAQAEHALFERYAEQARRVASRTGGITVLVSHRFSTVRMADLIVVVADGRVVEAGDHPTLAGAGGLYAELYALQAKAYS
jgi:ATP-binding cassette subfamily B protein